LGGSKLSRLPGKESSVPVAVSALAAVLPALLLLWYFYTRDVHPEPRGVVLTTFLLGVAAVVPILMVAMPLELWTPISDPLWYSLFTAFVIAALIEEFFKFLVVVFYCARHPAFDEPMDGIVYGATASLGFATLENILYVVSGGWQVAILRAFMAVPGHAATGAILGYYVGQWKFGPVKQGMLLRGFLYAWLLHGLYDFPLLYLGKLEEEGISFSETKSVLLVGMAFSVLLFQVFWAIGLVRYLRAQQLAEPKTKEG
jgi:RsiW-degrading membrane proteinase PrsW (M82 family)